MKRMNKPFVVRLDSATELCLEKFAKATNRSKANATRMAIQIASRLFVDEASMELEKQSDKDFDLSD